MMPQRFADRRRLIFRLIAVTCLTAASFFALSDISHTVAAAKDSATPPTTAPSTKFVVGRIAAPEIPESSGIVASRKYDGVFWTHNDSDNPPSIFAIKRDGELIREFPVDAKNVDWEDIAFDEAGRIYISDMGNNTRRRKEVQIYRVDEPDPRPQANVTKRPAPLHVTRTWRLTFSDAPFDCESLFIWRGKGYVLPKRLSLAPAELLSFDLDSAAPVQKLKKVADVPQIRAPVTAADISADGKQLAILTLLGPYLFDINGDIADIGKAKTRYSRYVDPHIEAVCFVPEGLLVTNESRDVFLFRWEHFTPVDAKR